MPRLLHAPLHVLGDLPLPFQRQNRRVDVPDDRAAAGHNLFHAALGINAFGDSHAVYAAYDYVVAQAITNSHDYAAQGGNNLTGARREKDAHLAALRKRVLVRKSHFAAKKRAQNRIR